MRTALRGVLAAALLSVVAGCATVPSGGAPIDYTQVAEPVDQAKPTEPDKGLGVLDVVRGFVNANARIDQDPKLGEAASYLSPAAQSAWQTASSEVMILAGAPRLDAVADRPDQVQLSGPSDGYLTAAGSFVTTPRSTYTITVDLVQVDGEWRIATPPPQLVISVADFNLAYTQRQVYFLNSDATLVVPDRRWLPNRSQYPATMASDLLDRLISGPSAALAPAVDNALQGAQRRAPIVANAADGVLEVDLTGLAPLPTAGATQLAAQLVYTMRSDAANIRILVDGVPLDPARSIWTTTLLSSFDPDVLPDGSPTAGQGFFLTPGGAMHTLKDTPVWGTAGTDAARALSAAVSAATGDLALVGVADTGQQTLSIGSPALEQPLEVRATGTAFSAPSFTRNGDEVWTVGAAEQPELLRLLTAGGRYPVDAASLASLQPITEVAISPDGVRLALVSHSRIYLASVVYTPSDSSAPTAGSPVGAATVTAPVLLRNDLTVSRVVWSDSQNVLVTASDVTSTYRTVWRIGLDGRQRAALSTRGIVADVEAVARSAFLPLLISSGGQILQLEGDDSSGEWVPAGPDGAVLAGSWPIYPS